MNRLLGPGVLDYWTDDPRADLVEELGGYLEWEPAGPDFYPEGRLSVDRGYRSPGDRWLAGEPLAEDVRPPVTRGMSDADRTAAWARYMTRPDFAATRVRPTTAERQSRPQTFGGKDLDVTGPGRSVTTTAFADDGSQVPTAGPVIAAAIDIAALPGGRRFGTPNQPTRPALALPNGWRAGGTAAFVGLLGSGRRVYLSGSVGDDRVTGVPGTGRTPGQSGRLAEPFAGPAVFRGEVPRDRYEYTPMTEEERYRTLRAAGCCGGAMTRW
ncbi:MAG: hypothetical protein QOE61_1701 [Micromonosporaceae bacterium]|nr:hypothetical protein [Micromonosporaceae bacterium]